MPFVVILGAGPLGGETACRLAARGRFDEVRLIDPQQTLAAGKALDILQSGPIDNSTTRVWGSASLEAAAGAWVLVLADPSPSEPLDDARLLAWLREARTLTPGVVVVCAAAVHRRLIARAVATGAVPPDAIIGSAPAAAVSAARALVALQADVSADRVGVRVVGGPDGRNDAPSIDWERSTIDGERADNALLREQRHVLDRRLAAAWPPGPGTLAAVAARVAEAAWFGSRRAWDCWMSTNGGASLPAALSVRFDQGGRVRVASGLLRVRR